MTIPPSGNRPQPSPPGPADAHEIAKSVADVLRMLSDSEPRTASGSLSGNVLACVFEGWLPPSQRLLVEAGKHESVRRFHEGFLGAVRDELVGVVASLSRREVRGFVAAIEPRVDATTLTFLLAPVPESVDEERRAILNWSEQVRRSSRRLNAAHARHVRDQNTLANELQRAREAADRERRRIRRRRPASVG